MAQRKAVIVGVVLVGALAGAVAYKLVTKKEPERRGRPGGGKVAAPVEVAPVEIGSIELRRTFTGTLESRTRFVVGANVGGRVEELLVELSDPVQRGQVVAKLDDADQAQGVAEANADIAVARANVADAESALTISQRELARVEDLVKRGLASEDELDTARSRHLSRTTAVTVAKAQSVRATASRRRARIQSNYTDVIASWSGDDKVRVVARRHVATGDLVAPGAALMTVVGLTPLDAVVYVTEREYAQLRPEQKVTLSTDAYPGRAFEGTIRRIAPEFQQSSRQARVEIEVDNADKALLPGMFVRAQVVLDQASGVTIVPRDAITTRGGKTGVFVVSESGDTVAWAPITRGISDGDRAQVIGEGVRGRVVTLGQQLIDDGSKITIPESAPAKPSGGS